jgi:hypothetical protein
MDCRLRIFTSLFILIVVNSATAISQYSITTAVPFLLISQSPEANGQGCTSVSRISDDPYAINFNPAHLGISSTQTNVMLSFYPTKTKGVPELGLDGNTFNTIVLSGGINLKEYTSLPISIGVAYSRVDLNLGTFNPSSFGPALIGTIDGEEHNDAFSLGVGFVLGIRLAMGITFRRTEFNIADFGAEKDSESAWTQDFGLLINVPIADLIAKKSGPMTGIVPLFNLSFGTSLTNVGEKMIYIDKAEAFTLPRNISIGTSLELGLKYIRTDHKFLSFTWSRQSDNLLVGRDSGGSFYRGGYGDVNFFKNIVQGKRTETIDLSQGWQIGIAEIVYIRGGSFVGIRSRSFTTKGIGLQASGFFKLLKAFETADSNVLSFIAKHFDIRYDQSEYKTNERGHPLDKTEFSSLSLIVKL